MGCEAQPVFARDGIVDAAPSEILQGNLTLGMIEQNALIVGRGALVDAEKIFALAQIALIMIRVRSFDDDAVAFGDLLHRFGESSDDRTP